MKIAYTQPLIKIKKRKKKKEKKACTQPFSKSKMKGS